MNLFTQLIHTWKSRKFLNSFHKAKGTLSEMSSFRGAIDRKNIPQLRIALGEILTQSGTIITDRGFLAINKDTGFRDHEWVFIDEMCVTHNSGLTLYVGPSAHDDLIHYRVENVHNCPFYFGKGITAFGRFVGQGLDPEPFRKDHFLTSV